MLVRIHPETSESNFGRFSWQKRMGITEYRTVESQIEGFRNAKLGIAISVTTVFIVATSELEK